MVSTLKDQTTEDRILEAAKQVFLKKGYAGARMQDIADCAGINKAMLHYYFRNKEKLFGVIFKESFEFLMPKIKESFTNPNLGFFDKINEFVTAYISMAEKHPYIPIFVLQELHRNDGLLNSDVLSSFKTVPLKEFQHAVDEAISKKLIEPISALHLFVNIIALCVFPFIAKPVICNIGKLSGDEFSIFIDERKKNISQFVIAALRRKIHES